MSLIFDVASLSEQNRESIAEELVVDINDGPSKNRFQKKKMPGTGPKYMYPYRMIGSGKVSLPMAWALKRVQGATRRPRAVFTQTSYEYNATLRSAQIVVKKEALANLNRRGTTIISAYPGFGKTVTSINLAHKIKMRTLVLVNKIVLIEQWISSIESFTDLKKGVGVVKVSPPTKTQRARPDKMQKWMDKATTASILIMNALNVKKMPDRFFDDIGCLIVDECHQLMSPCLSEALLYVQPRYVIALSATPYRSDGLNKLLDLYFSEERIVRKLKKEHTAVSLSKTRTILILTKRIDQAVLLESEIGKRVKTSGLYGTKKTFDKNCAVLVGTASKIGVGFDHKSLDCLILASDVEAYFIQFLGRVFRSPDVEPIIIDFVDSHPVLRSHFRTRKKVYAEHGGKVVTVKTKKALAALLT
jgi:superfamily II DNA or RNA helicase